MRFGRCVEVALDVKNVVNMNAHRRLEMERRMR